MDVAGAVSGTPGAVLVGGVESNASLTGKIVKIAPDGTVTTLFGPNNTVYNPSGFAFDAAGRLLITEFNNGKVLVTTGEPPTALFSLPQASQIAVDTLGRILVDSGNSTALRLYSSSGALSNTAFATVKASSPLARGPGGAWGTDIYADCSQWRFGALRFGWRDQQNGKRVLEHRWAGLRTGQRALRLRVSSGSRLSLRPAFHCRTRLLPSMPA